MGVQIRRRVKEGLEVSIMSATPRDAMIDLGSLEPVLLALANEPCGQCGSPAHEHSVMSIKGLVKINCNKASCQASLLVASSREQGSCWIQRDPDNIGESGHKKGWAWYQGRKPGEAAPAAGQPVEEAFAGEQNVPF